MRVVALLALLLTACQSPAGAGDGLATVQAAVQGTARPREAAAPELMQVGDEGRVTVNAADAYPLIDSAELRRELDVAVRNGEQGTVQRAVSEGRAVVVPNGARVRVDAYDGNLIQVTVLDGDQRGESGWLPLNLVRR